jgi:hypothetical protein
MTFNSFRQEAWNDGDGETMTFKVSDKKPGMIRL